MDKIFAITSTGKTEKSFLDLRFGKCHNVVLYNKSTDEISILDNDFINENHSGIKLVNFLKTKNVSTIITGEVGPMVSDLLEKEKLQLVLLDEERMRIEDIISRLKN